MTAFHHRPSRLARGLVGAWLALAASACATREQAPPETPPAAAPAESAPAAPAASAPSSDSRGSPGAGPTEGAARAAAPAEQGARNGPTDAPAGPPKLEGLTLPAGFSIAAYSTEVPNARSLALGPAGTVFVSNRTSDKVYALVDSDRDRRVERVHVVASGLESPNGIAYRNGTLYIAEIGRVSRIDGIDSRLSNPPEPKVITDQLPKEQHHGWRYLRFGPDGLLYIPVGAPCNLCERENPLYASIARMRPDGTGLEVFASGVRNSVGFDWHPQTKELWFTDNGRDELGDDLPPDELDRASRAGQHFGFPYCHAGKILDPSFGAGRSCEQFEPPAHALGAHVAALGMRFYTGKMFPEAYRGSIIVAEHGSWNRSRKNGYRVMVAQLDGNRVTSYEPLVQGWLDAGTDQVTGRPVDVEMLDDGSLLVSDDYRGAVYRVTYAAPRG